MQHFLSSFLRKAAANTNKKTHTIGRIKKASIFDSMKNINSRSKVMENLYKQIITAVKK